MYTEMAGNMVAEGTAVAVLAAEELETGSAASELAVVVLVAEGDKLAYLMA